MVQNYIDTEIKIPVRVFYEIAPEIPGSRHEEPCRERAEINKIQFQNIDLPLAMANYVYETMYAELEEECLLDAKEV